jgi:nitrate/nitrite transporter NarK
MEPRGFLKAGHWPSLLCAFLYFDTSFMVWVLFGALANAIVPDFRLNEAQRGLMLAVPLLGGFLLANILGSLKQLTDSFSGGFIIFGVLAFGCAGALVYVSRGWEGIFVGQ